MASSPTPVHPENTGNIPKSRFNQTVCLSDWWLVKTKNDVQGRRLAVSGFTCRGQGSSSIFCANESRAMRVFSSAPILKRYDNFTIETTDGICVVFKGLINKARTVENGFSSDVFSHFVFGFPLYWKEYVENCMVESEQPHTENCENDLKPRCKIDVVHKKSQTKKSDSLIIGSDCNLSMPFVAPGGLEDESYSMGRVRTRSMNSLKTKQNNDEKTAKVSGGEEIRNCESGSKNDCNSEVAEVHGFEDSDLRKVKSEGYVKKAKSKSNGSSGMKTRRNLAYETPDQEKDEVCASFNRSRSGRLLMPTLEFWRNQKPIYDVGRRITRIEGGSLPEQSKGSSTPVGRKTRRRR